MLELEMPHLLREPGLPKLTVSGTACDSCQFLIANLDDLPDFLRRDKVAHGCSRVHCDYDSVLENECECSGACLEIHDFGLGP